MPDNFNPDGSVTWHVTSQVEELGRSPAGGFVPGVLITFSTNAGDHGKLFVQQADYTPDRVQALIAAKVRTMRAVAGMGGPA